MAKDLKITFLLDFYGDMLTEKQREVVEAYYNEDLSLAEIAQDRDITRQGVRDAIVRAESVLRDTEDRLRLVRRYAGIQKDADQIAQAAQRIMAANSVGSRNAEIARQADVILKTVSHLSE